ncbi:alcohol dehydrogenase catalytic domain-containing protein [Acuticoccus sediminis]|uniref:alcohol dehydrogenase catalytic domain-containing protein n=1 Tax=Acuticoccus sediminis TaxID=2184697 RepID=UPI001CFCD477|nr:hypothetical protein [Acuticoccus sediminis]
MGPLDWFGHQSASRIGEIVTDTMKAIVPETVGAFEMRGVPVGVVGPRQVRVRVQATASIREIRRGDCVDQVPLPANIGHEFSGVVVEKGADVSEFDASHEV